MSPRLHGRAPAGGHPSAPRARRLALAAALGAALACPAAAQEPMRHGVWADAGLGYARLRLRCTNCSGVGTARGATATASVGISVSPRALLGLEGQVWRSLEAGPRAEVRSLIAVVQWYPFHGRHFFVRSGTGIVQGPVVPSVGGSRPETVKGTGVGLALGVGYDVPLGEHLGLAFQAGSQVAALGDLDLGGTTLDDTIGYVTHLAVAVFLR